MKSYIYILFFFIVACNNNPQKEYGRKFREDNFTTELNNSIIMSQTLKNAINKYIIKIDSIAKYDTNFSDKYLFVVNFYKYQDEYFFIICHFYCCIEEAFAGYIQVKDKTILFYNSCTNCMSGFVDTSLLKKDIKKIAPLCKNMTPRKYDAECAKYKIISTDSIIFLGYCY